MKKQAIAVVLLVLVAGSFAASQQLRPPAGASPDRAAALRATEEASAQLIELEKSHARTVALNAELGKLYETLSKKAAEVGKRAETVRAAKGGTGAGGSGQGSAGAIGAAAGGSAQDELLKATKEMQETQMSFNLQYLQLQSQMQNENRSYTAISNIMKTKHDTVKNSISNIR
jgi:glucose dehydrogenase